MESERLILTVQSTGNKDNKNWRLGVSYVDSCMYFKKRGLLVKIILNEIIVEVKTSCGPPLKKGFDFNGKVISEWITKNKYNIYPARKPTKLIFEFSKKKRRLF